MNLYETQLAIPRIIGRVTERVSDMHQYKRKLLYVLTNFRHWLCQYRANVESNEKAKEFIENGFVSITCQNTIGVTEYLKGPIHDCLNTGNPPTLFTGEIVSERSGFRQHQSKVSDKVEQISDSSRARTLIVKLSSKFLYDYIFSKELYDLLYSYYRKPFYLRNNPTIEFHWTQMARSGAENFHVDWGLRQVSVMISLSTLDRDSTYMEYLAGSQKKRWFYHANRASEDFKKYVETFVQTNPNCQRTTIGPRDSMFVFDAGNGLHRQVKGGGRTMLHMNFVDNFAYSDWKPNWMPEEHSYSYWFSDRDAETQKLIGDCDFDDSVFSLVLRNYGGRGLAPLIYRKGN